ncbi:hypothetical protein CC80DRAFT_547812 [Byssothecium circinans]|uniref:Uncharacterized protein n=1 Tax=Byssothecium circinans TaxID=147558 RepID=A0A6A5U259_9PLEO|nr:hypothetical protein CC80DRAFT_547812 [Byssothecium circinans]
MARGTTDPIFVEDLISGHEKREYRKLNYVGTTKVSEEKRYGKSHVPVPRAAEPDIPWNPLYKRNWGHITDEETFVAWMEDTKALLLENLKFWHDAVEDGNAARELKKLNGEKERIWKKWDEEIDIETGTIWDPVKSEAMKQQLEGVEIKIRAVHKKEDTWRKHYLYSKAQHAWEDFLYYQNEWNRRASSKYREEGYEPYYTASSTTEYDYTISKETVAEKQDYLTWLYRITHAFEIYGVGKRTNVPEILSIDDLTRYPDNIRNTTRQKNRQNHLDKSFPTHARALNKSGTYLTSEHEVMVDANAVTGKKRTVDAVVSNKNGRTRTDDLETLENHNEQRDQKLYHSCLERTHPFKWMTSDGKWSEVRTSWEDKSWGHAVKAGSWERGTPEPIDKPRYKKQVVYYPGRETAFELDENGHRILERMSTKDGRDTIVWSRWKTILSETRMLSKEVFRLNKHGERIQSQERCVRYPKLIYRPSNEKYARAPKPLGRRNRDPTKIREDEFSTGSEEEQKKGKKEKRPRGKKRPTSPQNEPMTAGHTGGIVTRTPSTNSGPLNSGPNFNQAGSKRPGGAMDDDDVQQLTSMRPRADPENQNAWDDRELKDLFSYTKTYVRSKGIAAIGSSKGKSDFINAATQRLRDMRKEQNLRTAERTAPVVITKLRSYNNFNEALGRAADVKARIDRGEDLPEEESHPTLVFPGLGEDLVGNFDPT